MNQQFEPEESGPTGPRRVVELRTSPSAGYTREMMLGVAKFARLHANWEFASGPENRGLAVPAVERGKPDGIIAQLAEEAIAEKALSVGVPVVNVSSSMPPGRVPTVIADDDAIGRLAAEHLRGRGFRQFVVFGQESKYFSQHRAAAFSKAVREAIPDAPVFEHLFQYAKGTHLNVFQHRAEQWLLTLPVPIALFSTNDYEARMITAACRAMGLRVPQDIAVCGVDNDVLTCEFSTPPLSSVCTNAERIGYRAAAMLHALLNGTATVTTEPVLVQPQHVVTRQSSDVLAVEDPLVADAVQYIRKHAVRGIQVPGVAKGLKVSRRTLERRFRAALNCSPAEEIRRTRTDCALRLLQETDLPVAKVARRSGFRYPQHLAPAVQSATGQTPTEFRRESRCS
ncbi:MAG: substrate-binding domain-containing protein [Phycisphaerae bacterium]